MMHETTVDVKARYKMLPNKEEGTACADLEDDNVNLRKIYRKFK